MGKEDQYKKLVQYVLDWYQEHETVLAYVDGDTCIFADEPSFVTLAKTLKEGE